MRRLHRIAKSSNWRRRYTPAFECLEERRLLSAAIALPPDTHVGTAAAIAAPGPENSSYAAPLIDSVETSPAPDEQAEAHEHFLEMQTWLWNPWEWNASVDDDWLEDLGEFYTHLNTSPSLMVTGLPPNMMVEPIAFSAVAPLAPIDAFDILARDGERIMPNIDSAPPMEAAPVRTSKERETHDEAAVVMPPPNDTANNVDVEPATELTQLADESSRVPVPADLIDDGGRIETAAIETGMRRFLDSIAGAAERAVESLQDKRFMPWLMSALLAAAAFELARRQLRSPTPARPLLHLAASSGLRGSKLP